MFRRFVLILLLGGLVAACGTSAPTSKASTSPTAVIPTVANTATVEPSPTPVPARTLVICLTEEPQTLYLYGSGSRSMWNVLEALYDGPIDTRGYSAQPVIVEKVPSLAGGDAKITPVSVQSGDPVVDVDGRLVALSKGLKVYPSGCTSLDCAVTWDGLSALQMDQLSATYTLKPGVNWSDGVPVTAADSLFSFNIAADPATPASKSLVDRTAAYKALDERTISWSGVPGFLEQRFADYFWVPLPEHALKGKSAKDLLSDPAATRSPLGWGPYTVQEWSSGDHILLKKNPAYFRAGEGLPKFDFLDFRFLGNPADSALMALAGGECDVVDRNPGFQPELQELINTQNSGKLNLLLQQGPEWEMLAFGIRPASYDDGYQPGADRPDFFGDTRVRMAVGQCIDRQSLNADFFNGRSSVPAGTLAPGQPFYQSDLQPLPYNPAAAEKLLDEAGWTDADNDPATPRVSAGVSGVPDGTPFKLTLLTTQADLRKQTAQRIAAMLQNCGIQVTPQYLTPGDLFAPGPDGPLFGRKFDLAEFSWEAGPRPGCSLFTAAQVPTQANLWTGVNLTGFQDADFDRACAGALTAFSNPDTLAGQAAVTAAEKVFAEQLPVLPLFFQLHIAITRPELCGLSLDPTARSLLWNLEEFEFSSSCQS
jgi:peptide/nickel transport system substrate-binding protein